MPELYLHEIVDITGRNGARYMEHAVAFHAEDAAGRGLTLLGTWEVVGATGRWPQVVNVWELVDGWEGWRRLVRHTNVRKADNVALAVWWDEALQWRSGGVDRLCAGAPGCPSLAELRARGVTGELFVHEFSNVHPGAAQEYLRVVERQRRPMMEDHGHRLVGLYEVLFTDVEVVTVWATTLDAHVRYMATSGEDPGASTWQAVARQFVTRWREELMTPHPGSPLAPRR
jgi:hypothetical protein